MAWKNTLRGGLRKGEYARSQVAGTNITIAPDWRFFKHGKEWQFPPRMADWYPCWEVLRNAGTPECEFGPKLDLADDDILPVRDRGRWGGRLDPYFWHKTA